MWSAIGAGVRAVEGIPRDLFERLSQLSNRLFWLRRRNDTGGPG